MSTNNFTLTKAAYTAEELMRSLGLTDLRRKCLVNKQTLKDGDFTLEEALSLYEVYTTDFESFVTNTK